LVTALVAAACVLVSALHLRSVASVEDPTATLRQWRRASAEEVTDGASKLPSESFVRRLVEATRGPTREHAVMEINEVLADIAGHLTRSATLPSAAARIAGTSGLLAGVLVIARGTESMADAWPAALGSVACGLAGAIPCLEVGRRARQHERNRIQAFNALVDLLGARLLRPKAPDDAVSEPRSRSARG
jgi:hypothetical protein